MKKTNKNIQHRIQLKHDEIERYKIASDRMKKYAEPYLNKLYDELAQLEKPAEKDNSLQYF